MLSAQMAELVDALGSGPSPRKRVEVRVFFWAPFSKNSEEVQRGINESLQK